MLTHYSKKIQNVIQKELFKAQKSIKIAVAWFTNDLLFQPLLLKLQTDVSVELILNKDEINDSEENDIDFNEFIKQGGKLHWNTSKTLMHEKFCIIDDNVVIFGSYNWTNKAEFNDESIAVSEQEKGTIDFYNQQFDKLANTYAPITILDKKEDEKSENLCELQEKDKTLTHQEIIKENQIVEERPKIKESRYKRPCASAQLRFNSQRNLILSNIEKKKSSRKKDKELDKDIEKLKELADKGDPLSALYIGACYKYGLVVKENSYFAKDYFSLSAKHANKEAMVEMINYANCDEEFFNYIFDALKENNYFVNNLINKIEKKLNRKLHDNYKEAKDTGDIKVIKETIKQENIMFYYNFSIPSRWNCSECSWIELLASLGDSNALFQMGICSLTDDIVRLEKKAISYLEKAANKNHAWAQLYLGVCYTFGIIVDKNSVKAIEWYEKAAQNNLPVALYNLGMCYLSGFGIKRDIDKSLEYFLLAAEDDCLDAHYIISQFESWNIYKHKLDKYSKRIKDLKKHNAYHTFEEDAWLLLLSNVGFKTAQKTYLAKCISPYSFSEYNYGYNEFEDTIRKWNLEYDPYCKLLKGLFLKKTSFTREARYSDNCYYGWESREIFQKALDLVISAAESGIYCALPIIRFWRLETKSDLFPTKYNLKNMRNHPSYLVNVDCPLNKRIYNKEETIAFVGFNNDMLCYVDYYVPRINDEQKGDSLIF